MSSTNDDQTIRIAVRTAEGVVLFDVQRVTLHPHQDGGARSKITFIEPDVAYTAELATRPAMPTEASMQRALGVLRKAADRLLPTTRRRW